MVAETEAVERHSFPEPVPDVAVQFQGLIAAPECSRVVAKERVAPADPVQSGGLPGQVIDRAIVPEPALGMGRVRA